MDFNEITRRLAEYDREAGIFIDHILTISALWDDLIDHDKDATNEEINSAFEIMLINLPRNHFYMTYFNDLNPVLITAIQNWYMANSIERDSKKDLFNISFIIRSSYVDLITMTAYILGGTKLAQELGMAAREFAHDEGLPEYILALENEIINRGDK